MNHAATKKWFEQAFQHARRNPVITVGLALTVTVLVLMILQNAGFMEDDVALRPVKLALMAGFDGFLATAFGALPALLIRTIPAKLEDSMLGFAAGMMLAASSFSLIIPGMEAAVELFGSKALGSVTVVGGMALGVLLMLGLEQFTPHNHTNAGSFGPAHESYGRMWLFVFAIALHNLPEGMAFGVSFAKADLAVGLPVSTAIAIQDVPEGLAVALALRGVMSKPWMGVFIGALTGILEPIGALIGVFMASGVPSAYPIAMGIAAGAMIFVVSHEVIPETHRNGHQTVATMGLMVGFATMMLLDTALG